MTRGPLGGTLRKYPSLGEGGNPSSDIVLPLRPRRGLPNGLFQGNW
jgi:hypothetical protein